MNIYPGHSYALAWRFPLATAFLLSRHRADVRSGGDSPDNPLIAAMGRAMAATRDYYEEHFTIVKG